MRLRGRRVNGYDVVRMAMTSVASETHDLKRGVDYIGVTVVFYCHDGAGRLLLHKRSDRCRDECGRWDVGGGSMEFGETFEEAVRREVREEYGVEPIAVVHAATTNVLRVHEGRPTHWVANIFAVRVPEGARICDAEKMDAIGWFMPDALPEPLHSCFHRHFEHVRPHIVSG